MGVLDGVCHVVEAWDVFAACDESPVDPIEVAEDGDVQSGAFDGWSEGQHGYEAGSAEVEGERRSGDVGDHEVDRDGPAAGEPAEQSAGEPEAERTGEFAEFQDGTGADRAVFFFRAFRRVADMRDLCFDFVEVCW